MRTEERKEEASNPSLLVSYLLPQVVIRVELLI